MKIFQKKKNYEDKIITNAEGNKIILTKEEQEEMEQFSEKQHKKYEKKGNKK